MPIRSKPFYWAECDHEGCGSRLPNGDDSDISAYAEPEQLFEDIDIFDADEKLEREWIRGENGETWCPRHAPGRAVCSACGGHGMVRTDQPLEGADGRFAWAFCESCEHRGWVVLAAPEPDDASSRFDDEGNAIMGDVDYGGFPDAPGGA